MFWNHFFEVKVLDYLWNDCLTFTSDFRNWQFSVGSRFRGWKIHFFLQAFTSIFSYRIMSLGNSGHESLLLRRNLYSNMILKHYSFSSIYKKIFPLLLPWFVSVFQIQTKQMPIDTVPSLKKRLHLKRHDCVLCHLFTFLFLFVF